jgi:hypothetical protein
MANLFTKGIIRAFWGFLRRDVYPRRHELLWSQHTLLAVIVGALVASLANHITGAPKIADVALGFIAYAAIALAFCVAGITISLTLPDRDFLLRLAEREIESKSGNALSGLLFVFTWTGVVHWFCLIAWILVLVLDGGNQSPFTAEAHGWRLVWIGGTAAICAYALETFLLTVLTLGHVGRVFIDDLRKARLASRNQ